MKKTIALFVAISLSFGSVSQAFAWGNGDDNSTSIEKTDARKINKVLKGVVLQVSDAKIDSSKKSENAGVGAGVVSGAAIGAGTNNGLIGMAVGAAAGAIAGGIAGAFAGSQDAQDLIIQLDAGDIVNITQAIDDKIGKFADGDAVLIVYKGDSGRVIRNKLAGAPAAPVAAAAAKPAAEQ